MARLSISRALIKRGGVMRRRPNCSHTLSSAVLDRANSIAFRDGFAKAGQRVIVVAGVPLGTPGATNMLRIAYVGPNRDAAM